MQLLEDHAGVCAGWDPVGATKRLWIQIQIKPNAYHVALAFL